MTTSPAARSFHVRHVQLARAAFAAIAAIMVTFSPDHSAVIGLSIFSGFALATGLVLVAAGWFVYTVDTRWPSVGLGSISVIAGMIAGIAQLRTDAMFFVIVISWALLTGLIETITGARALRAARGLAKMDSARTEPRDGLTVGILTIVLGLGLLVVPAGYALRYTIDEANTTFTLTGIIIGVGLFGGYAAILAVYLGIAGLSPRKPVVTEAPGAADDLRASAHDERGTV
ncbi:acyl-CoA synthetase [uncultured Microbacterium sp.]|uniref:acyl-CoA synthetase n=1 Tax=uncultured Microbacterium sp. TaxID=191216 RepID=UPI0028D37960|nr:acyl-CoA synthetase [uncultured Microbacterium sp.]